MIDLQFIRDNPGLIQKTARAKNINVDLDKLLKLDKQRKVLLQAVESTRAKRNDLAAQAKGGKPDAKAIKAGKDLKDELAKDEARLASVEKDFGLELERVPNIFSDDTPLGNEDANRVIKRVGKPLKKPVHDHMAWSEQRGYIDFERGAKVAGNKFYYLMGPLVQLELACMQLALKLAANHGFIPMTVPHLVNEKTATGTGFSPRGQEDQIYTIAGEDLSLIATAEVPITGYHSGEVIEQSDLPLLYVGISPAYRKEAGAYGKHSKGLYRVHQFNKVEMYVFCAPADSERWHEKLISIEEELCRALGVPYQLVQIAAGDLGAPAYKKFDIEYWSPVEEQYRELMSCSNVTDFQARRLNIRFKNQTGEVAYLHTLNGTAMAFSRVAIALIENHQTKDGRVLIPKALRPFMGRKKHIA